VWAGLILRPNAALNAINSLTLEEIRVETMESENTEPIELELLQMRRKRLQALAEKIKKAASFDEFAAELLSDASKKAKAKTEQQFAEKEKPQ